MTSENNNSVKESVGKLVYLLFGPAAKEAGDALGDYVRTVLHPWRMSNLEKLAAQVKARIGNAQTISLPPKTAIEFVSAASMVDDEWLRTLWANLLCQYLVAGAEKRESFVEILRQLSPMEARIFNALYEKQYGRPRPRVQFLPMSAPASLNKKDVMEQFGLSEEDYVVAHQNLLRIGIISRPTDSYLMRYVFFTPHNYTMPISEMGVAFGDYVIAPSLARDDGEPDKGAD